MKNGFDITAAVNARAAQLGATVTELTISATSSAAVVTCHRPNKYTAPDEYCVWTVYWPDGLESFAFHHGHYDLSREQAKRVHVEKFYRV